MGCDCARRGWNPRWRTTSDSVGRVQRDCWEGISRRVFDLDFEGFRSFGSARWCVGLSCEEWEGIPGLL